MSQGIFADQDRAQILNRGLDQRPATRLADAIDALIGEDFDKEPVACLLPAAALNVGMHEVGFDFGYFHWLLLMVEGIG